MRLALLLLLSLLIPSSLEASDWWLKTAGSGAAVPGLIGTTGNEKTLEYLMKLPSYQAVPSNLVPLYFSSLDANTCDPILTGAKAGTCLVAGLDANACTAEQPCLTWTKCEELSQFGNVHCIFDSADVWDSAAEHTGDNAFILGSTATCNRPNDVCILWGGSDRVSADPVEFDCAGVFGITGYATNGLFTSGRSNNSEFWAFENIIFDNCPNDIDPAIADDLFRNDSDDDYVTLNVQAPDHRGPDNDYYTSHNGAAGAGKSQSQMIAINPTCIKIDWVQLTSQMAECFDPTGNDDIIVIGGEMSSRLDHTSGNDTDITGGQGAGDPINISVLGTSFRNLSATSAGVVKSGIDGISVLTGQNVTYGIFYSSFEGFDNTVSDRALGFNFATGTAITIDATVYKLSMQNSDTHLLLQPSTTDTASYVQLRGACLAMDIDTDRILDASGAGGCDRIGVALDQVVADEGQAGSEWVIEGVNSVGGAAAETQSTAAGCLLSPFSTSGERWTINSVNDATPFGATSVNVLNCRDASCANGCTVGQSWVFPNAGEIPAFVVGTAIQSFTFSGPSSIGR